MNENKYEQRVRQRAEEFAVVLHPNSLKKYIKASEQDCKMGEWAMMFYRSNWHRIINEFIPAARLSIQWEAEAYVKGRSAGYDLGIAWEKGERIVVTPIFELQSLGLVPVK